MLAVTWPLLAEIIKKTDSETDYPAKPWTLTSKPWILNPEILSLDPEPWTLNYNQKP